MVRCARRRRRRNSEKRMIVSRQTVACSLADVLSAAAGRRLPPLRRGLHRHPSLRPAGRPGGLRELCIAGHSAQQVESGRRICVFVHAALHTCNDAVNTSAEPSFSQVYICTTHNSTISCFASVRCVLFAFVQSQCLLILA